MDFTLFNSSSDEGWAPIPFANGLSVFVGTGGLVGVEVSVDVGVNVGVIVGVGVTVHFAGKFKEMLVGGTSGGLDAADGEHAANRKKRIAMPVFLKG